ncbi:MAG: hypothetical protein ACSLFI_13875 [Solirubrobacterales bacterium]
MGGRIPARDGARGGSASSIVIASVLLLLLLTAPLARATTVSPSEASKVAEVRPEFISFGVDMSQLTERNSGQPYDFTRPALLNLAKPLAPAFIRYSGTKVERTFYDDSNLLGPNDTPNAGYDFILSRDEWDAANQFAADAGLSVMASTSAGPGPRNPDGSWNPDNATALLQRAVDQGYPVEALMLGNEPNITYYGAENPTTYKAADYADDVDAFLQVRNSVMPDVPFVGPGPFFSTGAERPLFGAVLGPDVSDIMALTGDAYDAVSYHQYPAYGDSDKCKNLTPRLPADTLSDAFLDIPKGAYEYMDQMRDEHAPGKPLWIDESGNTACGGVLGYSDKFISTFYYLNSLGYLAQQGVEVVTRWTISGPQPYALIDDETLKPRADYWAALMWRKLMGETVLAPEVESPDPKVRVYSQCLPDSVGGVTTLLLNTNRTEARSVSLDRPGSDSASQYVVTGALDGDEVSLNGALLEAGADGTPPEITGVPVQEGSISVPAASYAFVTVPGAESVDCGEPVEPHPDYAVHVKLTAPKQSLGRILRTGRIHATCKPDMASRCRVYALIPRRQARRIGLKQKAMKGKVSIGSTAVKIGRPAARKVTLKLGKHALKRLRMAPPRFRPRITLVALASGESIAFAGSDTLRLRLKR